MSSSNSAGSTNQLISKYRFPESSSLVSIHNAVTNRKQDSRGKILTTRVLRLTLIQTPKESVLILKR